MKNLVFKALVLSFGACSIVFSVAAAVDRIEFEFVGEWQGLIREDPESAVVLYKKMEKFAKPPKMIIDLLKKYKFTLSLESFAKAKASVQVIQELIAQGFNIQNPQFGESPLVVAAEKGYETLITAVLAKYGEDQVARSAALKKKLCHYSTPFCSAAFYGHEAAFLALIRAFGDDQAALVEALQMPGGTMDLTPLHNAALSGNRLIVELILFHLGIEALSRKDKRGRTPLHLAAQGATKGSLEVVRFILERAGCEVAALLTIRDADKRTPLEVALFLSSFDIEADLKTKMEALGISVPPVAAK